MSCWTFSICNYWIFFQNLCVRKGICPVQNATPFFGTRLWVGSSWLLRWHMEVHEVGSYFINTIRFTPHRATGCQKCLSCKNPNHIAGSKSNLFNLVWLLLTDQLSESVLACRNCMLLFESFLSMASVLRSSSCNKSAHFCSFLCGKNFNKTAS